MKKESKTELAKRWLLLVAGLFVMALGVGFSIKADLGTSPISSLPYTVSLVAPAVSVGTATIIMHCVFLVWFYNDSAKNIFYRNSSS